MPELPEVETVRRQLEKQIVNKKIRSTSQSRLRLRKPYMCSTSKIKSKKVIAVTRWGKRLFVHLDDDLYFDISLGMTGSFRFEKISAIEKIKHDHIKIDFQSDHRLVFNDPRRFGWFMLCQGQPELIGWDPLLSQKKDYQEVVKKALKSEMNAYNFLMDQKNIIGLGNIYVQEILFLSKISPFKKIRTCSLNELELIQKNTIKVLKKALKHGGSTIINYKDAYGNSGDFQKKLNVYGKKKGEACSLCKSPIKHVQLSRSISFCEVCQS